MLCIADPHLGSIDDVIVFLFFSTCLQSEGVTPRLRFREAEASDLCDMTQVCEEEQENTAEQSIPGHSQDLQYYNCSDDVVKPSSSSFRDRIAHHVGGQSAEVLLFLSRRAQFGKQRVDQRVLDVTEHGHRGVHLRQLLNDQNGGEECGAGAAVLWVNLNAHELQKYNQSHWIEEEEKH